MIRPRQPERVESAHSFPPHQDVIEGVLQGVPHVERTGEVRRRDNRGESGLRGRVVRKKVTASLPKGVPRLLLELRVISLWDLLLLHEVPRPGTKQLAQASIHPPRRARQ